MAGEIIRKFYKCGSFMSLKMDTVSIPTDKLGIVLSDVEKLISDFEVLVEDQDGIARQRLADIKAGHVQGKSEKELDSYLKQRFKL